MSPSIEFLEVRKRYGAQPVLRGVSFAVQRGEILGLLGPNGCGKTTTLRLVAGFLSPDSGEVRVCGEALGSGSVAARRRIGYLPERAPLYDALRVRLPRLYRCGEGRAARRARTGDRPGGA